MSASARQTGGRHGHHCTARPQTHCTTFQWDGDETAIRDLVAKTEREARQAGLPVDRYVGAGLAHWQKTRQLTPRHVRCIAYILLMRPLPGGGPVHAVVADATIGASIKMLKDEPGYDIRLFREQGDDTVPIEH